MAMAPENPSSPSSSSTPDFGGEKVSISQLILSRLDDLRHDQDILRQEVKQDGNSLRQEMTTLRQETKQDMNGLRQEISALRYWAWGSSLAVLVATVTIILTLKP